MSDYYFRVQFIASQKRGASKHDGTWRCRIHNSQHRQLKSKSFKQKADATRYGEDYCYQLRRGIEAGHRETADPTVTMAHVINEYEKSRLKAGKRVGESTGRDHAWWILQIGHIPAMQLTADHVGDALDAYMAEPCQVHNRRTDGTTSLGRPRGPGAYNRKRASLSAVCKWAKMRRQGYLASNPVEDVESMSEGRGREPDITRDDLLRVLELAKDSPWDRCHLFLMGLMHLGCRKSEWLHMEWQRIDLKAGYAYLETSKNGDARAMPLTPPLIAELKRMQAGQPVIGGLLFPAGTHEKRAASRPHDHRKSWDLIREQMGWLKPIGHPDRRVLHDIRHASATLLLKESRNLKAVGAVLGHKSMQSTDRYAHVLDDEKRELVNSVWSEVE